MAFMQPVAEYFHAYHVDTGNGTEIIPVEVCGELDESNPTFVGRAKVIRDTPENIDQLRDYLESDEVYTIERQQGWYARLSANGYLDCTSWDGPYDSAEEALEAVQEFYEVDANGDDSSDCDESEGA